MKNAVGYIRVSSQDQKSGFSPDAQIRAIEQKAEREDCKIIEFYKDIAKSGFTDKEDVYTAREGSRFVIKIEMNNRDDFVRLIDDCYKKKFNIVYFWKLDRIARNLLLQEGIFYLFERLGIEIRCVEDSTEKTVRRVMGTLNEKSSDDTSTRGDMVRKERIERGLLPFKTIYGYNSITDGKKITGYTIGQDKAEIILDVFKSRAKQENKEITCKRNKIEEWLYYQILKHKEYTGWISYKGTEKYVKELEIISLDLWKSCQK